jgi:ribonuclease R
MAQMKRRKRDDARRGGGKRRDVTASAGARKRPAGESKRGRRARERGRVVEGRVSLHRKGFGFLIDARGHEPDLFLSPAQLAGILDGDTVRAEVVQEADGRAVGRILSVLSRAHRSVVGVVRRGPRGDEVMPDGATFRQRFALDREARAAGRGRAKRREPPPRARDGEVVEIEILEYPSRFRAGRARVLEVLGDDGDPDVAIERIIRRNGLRTAFPDAVLAQAEETPDTVGPIDIRGRRDLRGETIVTIDGETARDFDDAVSVAQEAGGVMRLWVSIADVAHYVAAGSPLDVEARERGTSVYFPTRVLPMLPERLSNGICSLNPGVDRLTLTAEIAFGRDGSVLSADFYESVIRSAARLTYTKVAAVLRGERVQEIEHLRPQIALLGALMRRLCVARRRRGSIDFDLPEPEITIDMTTGEPESIVRSERNDAHRLIEEMMIAANEAVARWFAERRAPTVYRVHAGPDPAKIESFAILARSFGFEPTFGANVTPLALAGFLGRIEGKPYERALNTLLLRSMARAEYSERNIGHYGLASKAYLHFTSPIRRYPDLIVHRLMKARLHGATALPPDATRVAEIARWSSAAERTADLAEYAVVDYWRARYMLDKIDEEYDGVVSGVAEFGVFVELLDVFVEGMIRVAELSGDFFILADTGHALVGRKSGLAFAIGDRLRVAVESVNLSEGRVDFRLVRKLPQDGEKP